MSLSSSSSGAREVKTPAGGGSGSRALGDGSEQHVGVAGAEVEQELGEPPVGTDGGEYLFVFDLTGHRSAGDAFGLEGIDEAGERAPRGAGGGGVGGGP